MVESRRTIAGGHARYQAKVGLEGWHVYQRFVGPVS